MLLKFPKAAKKQEVFVIGMRISGILILPGYPKFTEFSVQSPFGDGRVVAWDDRESMLN